MADPKTSMGGSNAAFPITRWSQVQHAREGDGRREALDGLVRAYWKPLYSFLRASGRPNEDAKDLVQGFFEGLLEKNVLAGFDPGKGRFRTYLLACLKNHCADERDRETAAKRGGGRDRVSIETAGDGEYMRLATREESPEEAFDRAWAVAKMNRAIDMVRRTHLDRRDSAAVEAIDGYLAADSLARPDYAALMKRSGLSESRLRHLLHQFRQRVREAILSEVHSEITDPAAAEQELALIFQCLTGSPGR
ncbi:MAG: sigma-70 family RNA polymerase sigma factor [Planctomycetota bacterium]